MSCHLKRFEQPVEPLMLSAVWSNIGVVPFVGSLSAFFAV